MASWRWWRRWTQQWRVGDRGSCEGGTGGMMRCEAVVDAAAVRAVEGDDDDRDSAAAVRRGVRKKCGGDEQRRREWSRGDGDAACQAAGEKKIAGIDGEEMGDLIPRIRRCSSSPYQMYNAFSEANQMATDPLHGVGKPRFGGENYQTATKPRVYGLVIFQTTTKPRTTKTATKPNRGLRGLIGLVSRFWCGVSGGAAVVRRAELAARRGLAAELQQGRMNGVTPAKVADARQLRWRLLINGGAAEEVADGGAQKRVAAATRERVGWCGYGLVGAGTTPATPTAAAERREETAVRGERSGNERRGEERGEVRREEVRRLARKSREDVGESTGPNLEVNRAAADEKEYRLAVLYQWWSATCRIDGE
ncbi:hypothetical protein Syun_003781 [Stephania yunnanensis]|uniref:Uncharacterized protein n=1 Tax=Stephania yunnanensis TaxID=152371 RepID=A0AAP0Q1Y0_9MAGN